MKKIVVIMIIGLYIGSIFLVNVFGLQYVMHELNVYVKEIKCETITDPSGKETRYDADAVLFDEENQIYIKCFKVNYIPPATEYTTDKENLDKNPNSYRINCECLPDNANNKKVKLVYDKTNEGKVFVINEEEMTITFLKGNNKSVRILIVSADGSNVKEEIQILIKKQ